MLHIHRIPFPVTHRNKTELLIEKIPKIIRTKKNSEFRVQTETSRMITSGERAETSCAASPTNFTLPSPDSPPEPLPPPPPPFPTPAPPFPPPGEVPKEAAELETQRVRHGVRESSARKLRSEGDNGLEVQEVEEYGMRERLL